MTTKERRAVGRVALAVVLASAWASGATAQDYKNSWPPYSCLESPAEKEQSETIKLQFHDWDSHNLMRWVYAIILKEGLGYAVEFVDSNATPTYMLYEQLAKGDVDINAEVWGASKQAARQQWVVEDGGAEDLGYLGTAGTESLFVSSDFAQSLPPEVSVQYYGAFSRREVIEAYLVNATTTTRAPVRCQAAGDGDVSWALQCPPGATELPDSFACTDASYPAWECQQGVWYSDACCNATATTCAASPSALEGCLEVWFPSPGWTSGILEQILQNLDVPASFVYHGTAALMQSRVEATYAAGQLNPVYFWFYPDPWSAKLRDLYTPIESLVFPPWSSACYANVVATPEGSIACATQSDFLAKVVNSKLKDRAPNAHNLAQQFTATTAEYELMFAHFNNGSNYFDSACALVRAKREDADEWASLVVLSEVEYVHLGTTTSIIILSFSSLTLALALGVLVMFSFKRDHEIVRNAGLAFTAVQLLGYVVISAAAIMFCSKPTTFTCSMRTWFLTMGFVVSFSPLLAKTWRIYRIFNNPNMERRNISVVSLWSKVAVATVCMLVLMIVWQVVGSPTTNLQTDTSDWRKIYRVCTVDDSTGPVLLVSLYGGVLAFSGFYLATKVSDVPDRFNESREIGITLYTFVICGAIGTIVPSLLSSNEVFLQTYVQAGLTMFVSLMSVVFLFTGKVFRLTFNVGLLGSDLGKSQSKFLGGAGQNDELLQLQLEVADLRARLDQRQQQGRKQSMFGSLFGSGSQPVPSGDGERAMVELGGVKGDVEDPRAPAKDAAKEKAKKERKDDGEKEEKEKEKEKRHKEGEGKKEKKEKHKEDKEHKDKKEKKDKHKEHKGDKGDKDKKDKHKGDKEKKDKKDKHKKKDEGGES